MSTVLSHGVPTTLKANVVYALPSELTFITAAATVSTSLDGVAWTVLTGVTTGAVTGSVFVRAPADTLAVTREATNAINVPGSQLASLSLPEREFADIKAEEKVKGTIVNIKDSKTHTLGQVVLAHGTNSVLARYNGTNWIVIV